MTATYDVTAFTDQIRATFLRATDADVQDGKTWYSDAHQYANHLASKYGLRVDVVASVIAAISPNCSWEVNKRDADVLIGQWQRHEPIRGIASWSNNVRKAVQILETSNPDLINTPTGPKVSAFADNITNPSTSERVTVDRHIWGVLNNKRYKPLETPSVTPKRVRIATEAYSSVATELGIRPLQLQAITWLVRKRELAEEN